MSGKSSDRRLRHGVARAGTFRPFRRGTWY